MIRPAAALLAALLSGALQAAPPARVLLVTGHDGPWHDWRATTPVLREILETGGRLEVDVVEDPRALETTDLSPYRLVVLHFSAGRLEDKTWKDPDERARRRLRDHVLGGGGLFVLHFACFAFRDWEGFEELAGRVWDRRTGHDPRGPFRVEVSSPDHPACAGLASFDADDELYVCLRGERPVEVFARARSKLDGRDHPMAFVHRPGMGRVFHTPLGHDVRALRMPGTADLVRRGAAWAAGLVPG